MLPRELIKQILYDRCELHFKEELKRHEINYEELKNVLVELDAVISGSFIIACLLNTHNYGDIDIFHGRYATFLDENNEKHQANIRRTFEKVTKYDRDEDVLCCPLSMYDKESELKYLRKIYLKSIRLEIVKVGENKSEKNGKEDVVTFIMENNNIDVLKCYYDPNHKEYFDTHGFYFPFDIVDFMCNPTCKILNMHCHKFDEIYDPWGRDQFEGKNVNYNDGSVEKAVEITKKCNMLRVPRQYKKYQQIYSIMDCDAIIGKLGGREMKEDDYIFGVYGMKDNNLKLVTLITLQNILSIVRKNLDDNVMEDEINRNYAKVRSTYKGNLKYINKDNEMEMYTDYQIYKMLYRCLKYISYGLHISNFYQYFK